MWLLFFVSLYFKGSKTGSWSGWLGYTFLKESKYCGEF